jgi:hypothetical protein
MIHVDRRDLAPRRDGQDQKRQRIGATRHGTAQG